MAGSEFREITEIYYMKQKDYKGAILWVKTPNFHKVFSLNQLITKGAVKEKLGYWELHWVELGFWQYKEDWDSEEMTSGPTPLILAPRP